ncbi:MAG TPA: class I SAM-dependent methyltransferase [Acidobacteriota bacterium]|nr:class I SAM-dependent methyltransferase [Acidobacteriota bacterium]
MSPPTTNTTSGSDSYYDDMAQGYNQLHGSEQMEKLLLTVKRLKQLKLDTFTKQTTVLDVGCGTGISSDFWVDQFGAQVTGIDPSSQLIAQNNSHKSKFLVASAEQLPFADNAFDLVVSFSAIHNFADFRKGLLQMNRVAKDFMIITVLNKAQHSPQICATISQSFQVVGTFAANQDTLFILKKKL